MPKAKRSRPIVAVPKQRQQPQRQQAGGGGQPGKGNGGAAGGAVGPPLHKKQKRAHQPHAEGGPAHQGQGGGRFGHASAGGPRPHGQHGAAGGREHGSHAPAHRGGGSRGKDGLGGGADGPRQLQCMSTVDRQAASIVGRLLDADARRSRGVTLKALVFAPAIEAKKATFAVTCEVLKSVPLLERLYDTLGLAESTSRVSRYTAYVLMYEVLKGEGLRQRGPAERLVLAQQAALREGLAALQAAAGSGDDWDALLASLAGAAPADGVAGDGGRAASGGAASASGRAAGSAAQPPRQPKPHPRWARVNLLRAPSVSAALAQLSSPPPAWPPAARSLPAPTVDALLPDLLRFPPGTDLHDHPLVRSGWLILQSKASCMPAHALAPQPGWTVVDACAAPGNKTTHVAALMRQGGGGGGGSGRVLAFDKDPRRLARLQANAAAAGAGGSIVATCADFLTLDPSSPTYAHVRGVILDPSCSGSGTTFTRMDHLLPSYARRQAAALRAAGQADGGEGGEGDEEGGEGGEEGERVRQLAKFQLAALRHALSFPSLHRLVYSTCSVHAAENEDVVAAALPDAAAAGFGLVDPFPAWHRRGLPKFPGCEKLVRTDAFEDETDGFFVAAFERQAEAAADEGGEGAAAEGGEGADGGAGGMKARDKKKQKKKKRGQGAE